MKLSGIITVPFHIGDFIGGTIHMSTTEKGAYLMLLLAHYQVGECGLKDDDNQLARICGLSAKAWKNIRTILQEKFVVKDGYWTSQKVLSVLQKVNDNSAKQRAKALKRHAVGNAVALPQQCQPKPKPISNNKLDEKDIIPDKPKQVLTKDDYEFYGKVIKLTKADWDRFAQLVDDWDEDDLEQYLDDRDEWLAKQPKHISAKWFMSTQADLRKISASQ